MPARFTLSRIVPRHLLFTFGLLAVATSVIGAEWPPAASPLPPGVRLIPDVAYLAPGRAEKLDVFLPARAPGDTTLRPAVVYFHGGGWDHGDKATERERNIGNHLSAAGYVFVSANYALGAGSWPRNLLDCKNAVRYLRAHAAEYGVDPARIAAMGTSAGGHLALMVAYTAGQTALEPAGPYPEISSSVRAVIDLYGITDLLTRQLTRDDGTPTGQPADSHAPAVLGAKRDEDPARWRLASPITHVTAASPPTFIAQGLSDATVDFLQSVELANALRSKGVPHELLLLEGVGHMFHLDRSPTVPLPPHFKPALFAFLAQQLGAPASPRDR
jgi:acetyl esterase/lipase